MKLIKVQTHANISLNKYWGKRDEKLFLPTKNSLTISLSELQTTTLIQELGSIARDEVYLNGIQAQGVHAQKIVDFINIFRQNFKINSHFKIITKNNFPTAAGLASSSSGFAALALALDGICNLGLNKKELSILARQGSGSACRSISGGFVLWHKGINDDGSDCYAEQILDHSHWPELRILVVIVKNQQKFMGSREGMQLTVKTSESYNSWLDASEKRLPLLIAAINKKNFNTVGELAQDDWHDMHKTMLETTPILNYWTTESHQVMQAVKRLCISGTDCFFTTEAGPNLKILCLEHNVNNIKNELLKIPGIIKIITCKVANNPKIESFNKEEKP